MKRNISQLGIVDKSIRCPVFNEEYQCMSLSLGYEFTWKFAKRCDGSFIINGFQGAITNADQRFWTLPRKANRTCGAPRNAYKGSIAVTGEIIQYTIKLWQTRHIPWFHATKAHWWIMPRMRKILVNIHGTWHWYLPIWGMGVFLTFQKTECFYQRSRVGKAVQPT